MRSNTFDSFFMKNFIHNITKKYGEDFYVFGEFWNGDTETNDEYLESIDYLYDLVDVASTKTSLELVKRVKISTFELFLMEHWR